MPFDLRNEITERDRIWALDEARVDLELSGKDVSPNGLVGRCEAVLGVEPTRVAQPAEGVSVGLSAAAAADGLHTEAAPERAALPGAGLAKPVPAPFEVSGRVKYFDPIKRYGFLVADDGRGDVLLHVSCLQAAGYRTAYEGARIHAMVQMGPKGLLAMEILSMDESTAIHPSERPQRTHVAVRAESGWERVVVKWYNSALGYGFLTRGDTTEDLFVHAETLRRWGFPTLRQGQILEVRWGMGSKGCMVAELRLVGDPSRWH